MCSMESLVQEREAMWPEIDFSGQRERNRHTETKENKFRRNIAFHGTEVATEITQKRDLRRKE